MQTCFSYYGHTSGGINVRLYSAAAVPYLQSPLLAAAGMAEHAFSTRLGGCSMGAMSSLNMAFHTGDCLENVLENRSRFFSSFEYDYREVVSPIQVHGTGLMIVNSAQRGEGALPGSARHKCDALISTEPGVVLTAYAADCLLLFIVAQDRPLVALAHAGWRGTLDKMAAGLVNFLISHYETEPHLLLAALSPAICKCCYEVGPDVAQFFRAAGWYHSHFMEQSKGDKWKLDLLAINKDQLLRAGLSEKNLSVCNWCTSCRGELFYSYRREEGITGRMIGFIALK